MVHLRTLIVPGLTMIGLLAAGLAAGPDDGSPRDPAVVLQFATAKVLEAAHRAPNYTCVETVQRDYLRPLEEAVPHSCASLLQQRKQGASLRRMTTDRLRLDVAMVQRGEIFSWVGASQFDDSDVSHLVREGPMGTGAFGALLAVVFQSDARQFPFERYVEVNGRSLLEYSFHVPQPDSHYKVRLKDNSWAYTAYAGRFQVDPESNDVVRLTTETIDLPAAANTCVMESAMDFGTARIGDAAFALPARASLRFVYQDGQEAENTTTFANCHEYRGESTIKFEEATAGDAKASKKSARKPETIPMNSRFTLELISPIAADTAAAGDSFTARLSTPIRDGTRIWARAGALVEGRLLRVQTFHYSPAETIVALRPESVVVSGSKIPFAAVRDWTRILATAKRQGKKGVPMLVPRPGEELAGIFQFAGEHAVVNRGFRSDWRTVEPDYRHVGQ